LQDGKAVAEKVTVACDSPENPIPKKRRRITPAEGISPGRLTPMPEKAKGAVKTSRSRAQIGQILYPFDFQEKIAGHSSGVGRSRCVFFTQHLPEIVRRALWAGTSSLRVEAPRLM